MGKHAVPIGRTLQRPPAAQVGRLRGKKTHGLALRRWFAGREDTGLPRRGTALWLSKHMGSPAGIAHSGHLYPECRLTSGHANNVTGQHQTPSLSLMLGASEDLLQGSLSGEGAPSVLQHLY